MKRSKDISIPKGKHARQNSDTSSLSASVPEVFNTEATATYAPVAFDDASSMPGGAAPGAASQGAAAPGMAASGAASQGDLAQEPTFKKKRGLLKRILKVLGIVLACLVGLCALVYVGVSVFFMFHFWPNSTIGTDDISLQSPESIQASLEDRVSDYHLAISGLGIAMTLDSSEAGVEFSAESVVDALFDSMNPWTWPLEITQNHDVTSYLVATVSEQGVSESLRSEIDTFNQSATAPVNAYVAFNETSQMFEVVPETLGTQINYDAVLVALGEAVANLSDTLVLSDDELTKPEVLSDDARLIQAASDANALILADVDFTMAGTPAVSLDASTIAPWVVIGEDFSVSLNEEALGAWVDEAVSAYSTVDAERSYTRADGKAITVSAGSYGWQVDRDSLYNLVKTAIETDQTGTVDMPCSQTAALWAGVGGRDWPTRYIDVDLSEQYARFYGDDGSVIWESAIVSGKPSNGSGSLTPSGVYYITSKASPSLLKGTNSDGSKYETEVTYWMPFVGNLIGLHDATWQSSFGGTRYRDGAGSHGCVNLPYSKAQSLYSMVSDGDVVVVHW